MELLQVQDNGQQMMFVIIGLVLRIVGAVVCVDKAKSLNRSTTNWGIFGFFMPIIAMIWIYNSKPKIDWNQK